MKWPPTIEARPRDVVHTWRTPLSNFGVHFLYGVIYVDSKSSFVSEWSSCLCELRVWTIAKGWTWNTKKENGEWKIFPSRFLQDGRHGRKIVCKLWEGKEEKIQSRGQCFGKWRRTSISIFTWMLFFFILCLPFKWGDQPEHSNKKCWTEEIATRSRRGEENITIYITSHKRGLGKLDV